MTAYRLVLWLLGIGAVVFVSAAGATVYQVLSPPHARVATAVTPGPLPDATPTAPVATAMAEPQPVVPAIAPAAPPPSAPQAARRPAGSVVVARPPIHRPASATVARQIPAWRFGGYPPPAATYVYPGYYATYAGYRPYAYYRVYSLPVSQRTTNRPQ